MSHLEHFQFQLQHPCSIIAWLAGKLKAIHLHLFERVCLRRETQQLRTSLELLFKTRPTLLFYFYFTVS